MPGPGKQLAVLLRTQDDPNDPSTIRSTHLKLPADPSEMLDALHRLGCDMPDGIEVRIEDTAKTYLRHLLGATTNNLMELDLLARRLADTTLGDSAVLYALTTMWPQTDDIPTLINMTHAVHACHVASNISDVEQLGRFLYDNDMLSEGESAMAAVRLGKNEDDDAYFALLGREYMDAAHGVITGRYYVEYPDWPKLQEVYHAGDCPAFQPPGHGLEADFYVYPWEGNEPEKKVHAVFPVSEQTLGAILAELGAEFDDLVISPTHCLIPEMLDCISLEDTVPNLNAFAVCMDGLQAQGKLPLYKALLEAHCCEDVQTACALGVRAHEYELVPAVHNPVQCARRHFEQNNVDLEIRRVAGDNLYVYGRRRLEQTGDVLTDYGMLQRKDGGPVLEPLQNIHEQQMM